LIQLFRKEVMEYRADRLHGEVNLAIPVRWQAIGYVLLAALIVALIFMFSSSYSRVETVSGLIVPDKGIAVAVPTRPGIVSQLLVKEGQVVEQGASLAHITTGETTAAGQTAPAQVAASLQIQDARLFDQSSALATASLAEQSRLSVQMTGLEQELRNVAEQIVVQQSLLASAQKELDSAQVVAARGFISRRDMLIREEQLANRKQQLSQLEQTRASKTAQLEDARRAIGQTAAQAQAQSANFKATRAELARQQVDVSVASGYVLTAPASGMATAITVKAGQSVGPSTPLLSIIPKGSKLRAELPIPATMIGFVRIGQEVKLSIDAFPYQQFGTIKARISSIPGAPISTADAKGNPVPVYITIAEIEAPYIMAFGKKQPLLSGMTLSARITTRKQSLFEWLFEPLYAVGRR
jgi:membrane fusion protein